MHPRRINLVGLKRLDGGTYADCKRPASPVKSRTSHGRVTDETQTAVGEADGGRSAAGEQVTGAKQTLPAGGEQRGNGAFGTPATCHPLAAGAAMPQ